MIIIPMAGLSSRFASAGYQQPKYMLPLGADTVFDHSVRSFARYFLSRPFMFIFRDVAGTRAFIAERVSALGIATATLVTLAEPTAGQAETVALGLRRANIDPDCPATVFNIDTFRPNFELPPVADESDVDGYLEVFEGSGSNWSFVRPSDENPGRVAETAEKRAISNLCCTGIYHFRRGGDFLDAYDVSVRDKTFRGPKDELFIAPLYNWLIGRGQSIGYHVINRPDVVFCGVPVEYEALRAMHST